MPDKRSLVDCSHPNYFCGKADFNYKSDPLMEKEMQIHYSIFAWRMDRGAWQSTVHGVERARTHTHTHTQRLYSMGLPARAHTPPL